MKRGESRAEEGFSVVEVVVAASILFFVLTAVLGLVAASQRLSVNAKQRAVVTNATAYYIDRVRAMPYDNVGIQGLDTSGTLPPAENLSFDGYTVTFRNSVSMITGADGFIYRRELNVRASCTISGRTYTTSAIAVIKNPRNDRTSATLTDPDAPRIEFDDASTPSPNSIVYGTQYYDYTLQRGGTLNIGTIASSPNDKIMRVQHQLGSGLLRDAGTTGLEHRFDFTPGVSNTGSTCLRRWDTSEGIAEGFQTVTATARDDKDRTVTVDRTFFVDNLPPSAPAAPSVNVSTDVTSTATVMGAPDGNQGYAYRYAWELRKDAISAGTNPAAWSVVSTGTAVAGATVVAAISNPGPINFTLNHQPFSRYWMSITPGSPRLWSTATASVTAPFISRPALLTATGTQSFGTTTAQRGSTNQVAYDVTLWVSQPSFPVDASALANKANYTVKCYDEAAGTWETLSSSAFSVDTSNANGIKILVNKVDAGTYVPKRYWFKAGIAVVPTNGGSMTAPVWSPSAGPAPQPPEPAKPAGKIKLTTSTLSGAIGPRWDL